MAQSVSTSGVETARTAEHMAEQMCRGFIEHDRGDRDAATDAFAAVDERQFRHVDRRDARLAATAFVEALWAKDEIEFQYLTDRTIDRDGLREADWSPVRRAFRKRASLLEIDQEYAALKTEAWRRHKTDGDYWTPFQKAQVLELRAALQDPEYPRKAKDGRSGFGPETLRYTLGVELHDMHAAEYWEQAKDVMTPYFERILDAHER